MDFLFNGTATNEIFTLSLHDALPICTPGMIMASVDMLKNNPNPTEEEIRHGLEGNFCRCTGYHNIVKSVKAAAESMQGGA